jgi:hypothetical protein
MERGIRKKSCNGMEMEWKLIKLCGMEWKWNENKFRKFHESIWEENNYKFQHFLMNRTNCLLIIHNKKTFYYRTLSCEMWILEFWNFFCWNIEWNGMWNEKKLVEWNESCWKCVKWNDRELVWNGNGIQIFKILDHYYKPLIKANSLTLNLFSRVV